MSNQTISASIDRKVDELKVELSQRDHLIRQYEKRINSMVGINDLAQKVVGSFSVNHMAESTYESVLQIVKPDMVAFYLVEDDCLIIKENKWANPVFRESSDETKQIVRCVCNLSLSEQQPLYVPNIKTETRYPLKANDIVEVQSVATIPFIVNNQAYGVLGLGAFIERDFSKDADFLDTISSLVANGLDAAIKHHQIRNATNKLEKSEEALQFTQFAVDHYSDGAFWMGSDARLIYVNEAACRSLGYTKEELLSMTVHDIDPNFPKEAWTDHWSDLKNRGSFLIETHHKSKNGTVFPVDVVVNYVKFGDKEYNCAFARNVSDRKQMEENLRQSEEKYRELFQSASDAVFLVDLETLDIVDANANAIDLYGFPYDELLKMKATELSDEPVKTKSAIQHRSQKIIPIRFHKKKDGTVFPVEITVNHSTLDEKKICISSVRDISKRLEMEKDKAHLEAELRESQKMEAIATLAGGVAHQFNNALAAVTGNIELLKEDLPNYDYIAEYIDPIKASAQKMVRLTKQLLAYARGGQYYSSILPTSDFLRNTIPLIKHKIAPKVDLDTDLPGTVSHIKADPTQIQMVISEILQNASEAVSGTGRVKISARNVEITETQIEEQAEIIPGSYVCLEFEDNGRGMDQETQKRLFEPFFTKKFEGRGLGMAAAFGIVKNHGGWISVTSEIGTGTSVQVYLPQFEERPGQASEKTAVRAAGTGTVLIVDDDAMFMNFAARAVTKLGYHILKAESGKDAIEIYTNNAEKIDLVLLDLILPEMGGDQIYDRLKAINPHVKVLLSSGYAMDNKAKKILSHVCDGFIQKPFTIGELSQSLKKILNN